MCIHPDQVPVANETFSPDAETIERARRAVAACEAAEREGLASIQLEGRFIDYPIVHAARRILAQAQAIAARKQDP